MFLCFLWADEKTRTKLTRRGKGTGEKPAPPSDQLLVVNEGKKFVATQLKEQSDNKSSETKIGIRKSSTQ